MSSPRRADAARNRAVLLAAARDHQQRCGAVPGLTELAAAAGLGVGTAYRNFPTPQALVAAMAADGLGELVAAGRAAAALDDSRALGTFVERGVRLLLADAQLADVVSSAAAGGAGDATAGEERVVDGGVVAAVAQLQDVLADLLARAQRAGAARSDLVPADVMRLACGTQHAVRLARGPASASGPAGGDDPEVLERYLAVLLAGLAPWGPAARSVPVGVALTSRSPDRRRRGS